MKRKVLVIDDDAYCLDIAVEYFLDKGFITTSQLRADCPMLQENLPACPMSEPCYDIIFSDNRMPEMTGLDFFIDQAQKGCKLPTQRKALISGDISAADEKKAKELGYKVFKKPCSLDILDLWIDELFPAG